MGKAPFGRVYNILGIYDTPAPATSELADAQSVLLALYMLEYYLLPLLPAELAAPPA